MPESLRQAGAQVQVHADHFPDDERDELWLAEAGARGWTVITRDRGIRCKETERTSLKALLASRRSS